MRVVVLGGGEGVEAAEFDADLRMCGENEHSGHGFSGSVCARGIGHFGRQAEMGNEHAQIAVAIEHLVPGVPVFTLGIDADQPAIIDDPGPEFVGNGL